MSKSCNLRKNSEIIFVALVLLMMASVCPARAQTIVNLQQLTQDLDLQQRLYRDVQLEVTVCAASRPKVGVLIVQDGSGVELLDVGNLGQEIHPGERIRLQGHHCLLRKRDTGIEISAEPVVNNDGVHNQRSLQGEATLKAGQNQIRLDCFNSIQNFNLNVTYWVSNGPPQDFSTSNFWHAVVDDSGRTNFLPGLRAECYEGDYWQAIPEISLLEPTRTGTVASFDIGFRTRDEMVAIRYDGYFNVPDDGKYLFRVHSRDGSILWLGKPELPILHIGKTNLPEASRGYYAEQMNSLLERRWITLEGHVNAVSKTAEGLELELGPDRDMVRVWVADAAGLDVSPLRNARVKVTGIGRGVLTSDHRIVLGKVFVASSKEIALIEKASDREPSVPIASIGQVRSLSLEDARHALPVRIQGVVTEVINYKAGRGLVLQDDMRGIYVNAFAASNISSALGQFLEVEGHTATGYFAPVINADKITYLGEGRLPEPAHPSWAELLNGSMDSQWTELNGLVTDVKSNVVTLLLPEGRLDVRMDGHKESELKSYEKNFVHICGVLGASWNAANREVQVGYVKMRNATVSIDASAPTDPFDAIVKTPRDLLRFDPQATAFRRVKVRGTIVYADATQVFLEQDGAGLRLLPADKTEVHPGDLVEAVGYPEIGRTALTLREVILRKTGEIPLPTANKLNNSELTQQGLDSTRVRITGQLLGWHPEQRTLVLEMQSGAHLYFARLPQAESLSLRIGSQLALDGVYVSQGQNLWTGARADFFELLLNSSEDIVVISQAPWWTLKRLLIFVGILLAILIFSSIWIRQLRRLVEQRTTQLQREIRERERFEHECALADELARIARDLHDDLGSSLTEIGVLASNGQQPDSGENRHASLFHGIASKSRGLITALDGIVWAVDPEDNSLQSLADYLNGYTADFFLHTDIACDLDVPVVIPKITLEGRVRHDLLMTVKEALNNIVRHAEAKAVVFRMVVSDHDLKIAITDDGKGFESNRKGGHGLNNMASRLQKLGGSCTTESHIGSGTTVVIWMPLPKK